MYYFAFDEGKGFETHTNDGKEPIIIGGLIYDDRNESEENKEEIEKIRIIEFLRACCETVKVEFPLGLHFLSNGTAEEKKAHQKKVWSVRSEISDNLSQFIRYGTYKGRQLKNANGELPQRRGVYNLVVILKKDELIETEDKTFMGDNTASNMYGGMVREFSKKATVFNLFINDSAPDIQFDFPTRVFPIDEDNKKEYKQSGYKQNKKNWEILAAGNAREIVNELSRIKPLGNKSGVYTNYIDYEEENQSIAFLYLSDDLCSYLKNNAKIRSPKGEWEQPSFTSEEWVKKVRDRMDTLNNPEHNMFFYYNGVNDDYDRACEAIIKKDVFDAVASLYDLENGPSVDEIEYHKDRWIPLLEPKIKEVCSETTFRDAVNKLARYSNDENRNPEKQVSIYKRLESICKDANISKPVQFKLYALGMAAYNHIGDSRNVLECFDKCKELEKYADDEAFMACRLRAITAFNDLLEFDKAEDLAMDGLGWKEQPLVAIEESAVIRKQSFREWLISVLSPKTETTEEPVKKESIEEKISKYENLSKPLRYKFLSSLGQVYAFQRNPLAENCFMRILTERKDDIDGDYLITESYLLHHYIDVGNKEKYQKLAKDYYAGFEDLKMQLDYIISEGKKGREGTLSFQFALYIFIKAFYKFYKDEKEYETIKVKLADIKDTLSETMGKENVSKIMRGHPWEIICKYSALLKLEEEDAESISKAEEILNIGASYVMENGGQIVTQLMKYGELQFQKKLVSQKLLDEDLYHTKLEELWKSVTDEEKSSKEQMEEKLANTFTFMYS